MKQAGLVIRMPANWRMNFASKPPAEFEATVGSVSPSGLGLDALLDFQVGVNLDGDALTLTKKSELLASIDGLALVRGKWVEVDRERLQATLDKNFRRSSAYREEKGCRLVKPCVLLAGSRKGLLSIRSHERRRKTAAILVAGIVGHPLCFKRCQTRLDVALLDGARTTRQPRLERGRHWPAQPKSQPSHNDPIARLRKLDEDRSSPRAKLKELTIGHVDFHCVR